MFKPFNVQYAYLPEIFHMFFGPWNVYRTYGGSPLLNHVGCKYRRFVMLSEEPPLNYVGTLCFSSTAVRWNS